MTVKEVFALAETRLQKLYCPQGKCTYQWPTSREQGK